MQNKILLTNVENNNITITELWKIQSNIKANILAVMLSVWVSTNASALSLWFENITSEVTFSDVSSSPFSSSSIKTRETVRQKINTNNIRKQAPQDEVEKMLFFEKKRQKMNDK